MVLWSYYSGFLFGAHVLMFPFLCAGCLLIVCSFWAPFMLPQYRQKHGGFKIGIGGFLADESVLMDLAIMADAFLLFVSNRLSLADVLLKFGPINAHSHTLMAFSSPLYILAASMWARMRMTKETAHVRNRRKPGFHNRRLRSVFCISLCPLLSAKHEGNWGKVFPHCTLGCNMHCHILRQLCRNIVSHVYYGRSSVCTGDLFNATDATCHLHPSLYYGGLLQDSTS
ncbi:uncharacterized protein LOC142577728 [Dermacentor variabilis]|uniref:uncharacterized protein LOC142577728 n=1 Tax=Dermacentor variabilis TaxID=34621 RepID=UPI003F5B0071